MTCLGEILLKNENSIVEARNKTLALTKGLNFDSMETARFATITSELSRSILNGVLPKLVAGIEKKKNKYGLKLLFESRIEEINPGGVEGFFDAFNLDRNDKGLKQLTLFKYIPDPDFKPSGQFMGWAESLIQKLSAEDLLIELRKQRTHLEEKTRNLETKNAELEQFAYTVSHDLKSPLVSIRGLIGLIEQEISSGDMERVKEDIADAKMTVDKMETLMEGLLELSRIGRVINPPEEVPMAELVRHAIDLVSGPVTQRRVRIEISPELPTVFADRIRLSELMQNLIENASKFMGDQKKPRIEVGARREGEETVFYVRDNGIGIKPDYHKKVFGIFDKLNAEIHGTGIGLALVKRIVEVHGGRIWIESEGAGQGSTFCFTLKSAEQDLQDGSME